MHARLPAPVSAACTAVSPPVARLGGDVVRQIGVYVLPAVHTLLLRKRLHADVLVVIGEPARAALAVLRKALQLLGPPVVLQVACSVHSAQHAQTDTWPSSAKRRSFLGRLSSSRSPAWAPLSYEHMQLMDWPGARMPHSLRASVMAPETPEMPS